MFDKQQLEEQVQAKQVVWDKVNRKATIINMAKRVDESVTLAYVNDLLTHYFHNDKYTLDKWQVCPQKVEENKKVTYFVVQWWHQRSYRSKFLVEAKPFDGDDFTAVLDQTHSSGLLGISGGYIEEVINKNYTSEITFSGANQYIVVVRGDQIAFLSVTTMRVLFMRRV